MKKRWYITTIAQSLDDLKENLTSDLKKFKETKELVNREKLLDSLIVALYMILTVYSNMEEEGEKIGLALVLTDEKLVRIHGQEHPSNKTFTEKINSCLKEKKGRRRKRRRRDSPFEAFTQNPLCFRNMVVDFALYPSATVLAFTHDWRNGKALTYPTLTNIDKFMSKLTKEPSNVGIHLHRNQKRVTVYFGGVRILEIILDRKRGTWVPYNLIKLETKIKEIFEEKNVTGSDNSINVLINLLMDLSASKRGGGILILSEKKFDKLYDDDKIISKISIRAEQQIPITQINYNILLDYLKMDGHTVLLKENLDWYGSGVKLEITGGRHESIRNFIGSHCPDCIGIVVSQDGPITLFYKEKGKRKVKEEML